jgi:hypothetical protein
MVSDIRIERLVERLTQLQARCDAVTAKLQNATDQKEREELDGGLRAIAN